MQGLAQLPDGLLTVEVNAEAAQQDVVGFGERLAQVLIEGRCARGQNSLARQTLWSQGVTSGRGGGARSANWGSPGRSQPRESGIAI